MSRIYKSITTFKDATDREQHFQVTYEDKIEEILQQILIEYGEEKNIKSSGVLRDFVVSFAKMDGFDRHKLLQKTDFHDIKSKF